MDELAELQQQKVEAEQALAAAKRRAYEDPKAEPDVAKCRDAVQRTQDRIDGFKLRQREQAQADAIKAKAAAAIERRKQLKAALKVTDERDALSRELDEAISRVGELRDELGACDRRLAGHFNAALRADFGSAGDLHQIGVPLRELRSTFQSTDELIAAELITRSGVPFPGIDQFDAAKPLVAGGFLARTMSRTAALRRVIADFLARGEKD